MEEKNTQASTKFKNKIVFQSLIQKKFAIKERLEQVPIKLSIEKEQRKIFIKINENVETPRDFIKHNKTREVKWEGNAVVK